MARKITAMKKWGKKYMKMKHLEKRLPWTPPLPDDFIRSETWLSHNSKKALMLHMSSVLLDSKVFNTDYLDNE